MMQQANVVLNAYEQGAVTGIIAYIEHNHPEWNQEEVITAVLSYGASYENSISWQHWINIIYGV